MNVALIGYGEVGRILAEDLRAQGVAVSAYDILLDRGHGQPVREHAAVHDVVIASSHQAAVEALVGRGAGVSDIQAREARWIWLGAIRAAELEQRLPAVLPGSAPPRGTTGRMSFPRPARRAASRDRLGTFPRAWIRQSPIASELPPS